ncbi:unnamed protein product [Haemonchus placei]|uniref:NADH-quinone oxidoreductase subunit H n=1 Tax=Haemonchus placei TaxID=6290 RepID=A0A0N4WTU0_HAEPC|nr:unnamed protein product [Haemonchus placei]
MIGRLVVTINKTSGVFTTTRGVEGTNRKNCYFIEEFFMPKFGSASFLSDMVLFVNESLNALLFREILLAPMIVAGMLGRVDVKARARGSGGITALPRAVRHGTALGIAALYPKTMEPLRLGLLLTPYWRFD